MINIAGSDSTVNFAMAESDSIYNDYERTITALHTIVLMLMFMSISLTLLLGLTQRYQELYNKPMTMPLSQQEWQRLLHKILAMINPSHVEKMVFIQRLLTPYHKKITMREKITVQARGRMMVIAALYAFLNTKTAMNYVYFLASITCKFPASL